MSWLDLPTRWALRYPGRLLGLVILLSVAVGFAGTRVELVTDVTELLQTPSAKTLRQVDGAFGLGQQAFLLLEAPPPGDARRLVRFGQALEGRLLAAHAVVASVALGPPVSADDALDALLLPYAPLYFAPSELDDLDRLLTREGMEDRLTQQAERLALMGLGQLDAMVERDPLDLHRPLLRRVRTLEGGVELDANSRYTLSADGRALLVQVRVQPGASPQQVVATLDAAMAAVGAEPWAAGIRARGTGSAYLAEESGRVIQADVIRGLSVSIVLAALLMAYVLRLRLTHVALLLVPTLWGAGLGLGLYVAVHPKLAVISLACTSILIGLGVDFTVHLVAASRVDSGATPGMRALNAVRDNRGALALAAITSIAAFGSFLSSEQGFLREMGGLTGLGLVTCLAAALVVLPPLLARHRGSPGRLRDLGTARLARFAATRPALVCSGAVALCLAAVVALVVSPPRLEDDLRRIHAKGSPPLATQAAIGEIFGGSREPILLAVEAENADAALAGLHALELPLQGMVERGLLASRTSLAPLLPPPADQRRVLEVLARHDPAQVRRDMREALDAVGFDPDAFADYVDGLVAAVQLFRPLRVADLDALGLQPLRAALVAEVEDGAMALVQLYPARDPWRAEEREALLGGIDEAVRIAGVDARPTGLLVVSNESAREVASDFSRICLLTGAMVLTVLLLRLRHPGHVLLALTPALLGTLWTAGVLAATGVRLNLMNLGVLPMVLAIGVDDGIHLLHRVLRGEGTPASSAFRATCAAVLLTSLTTMLTFGSLGFSRNQGIASVGVLAFLGVGASLLASILVLPALARLTEYRRR